MPGRKRKYDRKDILDQQPTEKILKKENKFSPDKNDLYWSFNPRVHLGRGSFGEVEIRYHHSKGYLCATKLFKNSEAYTTEIQNVLKLDHDNVIKLLDADDVQKIIQYKLASCTLEDLVENDEQNVLGLSDRQVRLLIRNMINASEYIINDLKMVHRDVKPSNILYDENECSFLLADFGLAIKYDPSSRTYTDIIRGTPDYMHPLTLQLLLDLSTKSEQTKEQTISIETEIWSLALCFFYASTGKHPFRTKTRNKWIQLAKDKPEGCFWIDDSGNYKYEFQGFCRLSEKFRADVFQPLVVYMMSKTAAFRELFRKINSNELNKENAYFINLRSFEVKPFPCISELSELKSIAKKAYNCEDVVAIHDNRFISEDYLIKKSDFALLIPIIANFKNKNDHCVRDSIRVAMFQRYKSFFTDKVAGSFNNKEVRCVFSNTFEAIKTLCEFTNCYSKTAEVYFNKAKSLQTELRILYDCFDNELLALFKIQEPEKQFSAFITSFKTSVSKALQPIDSFVPNTSSEIQRQFNIITCKQYMDFLNHDKFSAVYKGHVLQVKSIVDSAIEVTVEAIAKMVTHFLTWLKEIEDYTIELQSLIDKTNFLHSEISNKVVSEIINVRKQICFKTA